MKFNNNTILIKNIFDFIKENQKEYLIISPLTKIKEVINFTKTNVLQNYILEINDSLGMCVDENSIDTFSNLINNEMDIPFIKTKVEQNKFLKYFFEESEELIDENNLVKILNFLEKYNSKLTDIILIGFQKSIKLIENNYTLINLNVAIDSIQNSGLNWTNIETLIIKDGVEYIQIHSRDKLISWLEYKTKMVLTLEDLNNYFDGEECMNSFLIEKAFKKI